MQMQVPPTNGAIHLRPIGQNASNISQGSEAVPKKIGANVSNLSQKNMSSVHQTKFSWMPGRGMYYDLMGRAPHYITDWTDGLRAHIGILAPATYIFFASAIPALTFGEQLADETEGQMNGVHVLLATAICGCIQSIFGGQPLLIVGVAEPIVLVYDYMYRIAKDFDIPFVPWASCTLFWTSFFLLILAVFNTCFYAHHFTRFSGELFGLLIAILFLQQAVKGLASEFSPPHTMIAAARRAGAATGVAEEQSWLLFNGAFAMVLAGGLLYTSLVSVQARNWVILPGFLRRFIADYGTALFVLIWTLVSYIPGNTASADLPLPETIPRRLVIPDTFDGSSNYFVLQRMGELEGWHIATAMIPAAIIAVLFFFDHNVSSQLAQEGMHLRKPPAYHWDFFLLSIMTLICGCLGIPPVNGVIPQAPMHSRANAVWLKKRELKPDEVDDEDEHEGRPYYIRENRVSNLIQSLLCGVALLVTPVLQKIPRSVLWGFFAFMAIEGLPGNEFYQRMMLFITDPKRLHKLQEDPKHPTWLDRVEMRTIFKFTLLQFICLGVCYGITWAGIVGISFPLFIMLLVPAREQLFPKIFSARALEELDPLDLSHGAGDNEGAGTGAETAGHVDPGVPAAMYNPWAPFPAPGYHAHHHVPHLSHPTGMSFASGVGLGTQPLPAGWIGPTGALPFLPVVTTAPAPPAHATAPQS